MAVGRSGQPGLPIARFRTTTRHVHANMELSVQNVAVARSGIVDFPGVKWLTCLNSRIANAWNR